MSRRMTRGPSLLVFNSYPPKDRPWIPLSGDSRERVNDVIHWLSHAWAGQTTHKEVTETPVEYHWCYINKALQVLSGEILVDGFVSEFATDGDLLL